ncbi:MAG: carboxypeptidase-like regulatory domain-containing protein [Chitinophagaceae bacterium]|nr:carboxypeptidase-like regulatory domain-containing protein [Chitinophagaceae bacterium]
MFLKIFNNSVSGFIRKGLILLLLLTGSILVNAQTLVKGFIRDAITKRPISFATVMFKDGKGVTSDENGSYSIETRNPKFNTIIISFVGYATVTERITPGIEQTLDIDMELSKAMKEVVVKRGRGKYRNKNNPAVELIDKVLENKEKNRITAYDYVQYNQYEKLGLSLANTPEKLMKNKLFRSFKFIMENVDTTSVQGKSLLPIYIEEKLQEKYYRKNPSEEKTRILAEKKVNYGDFIDNAGISSYLKSLYVDINIYDNTIPLLQQQFLSPIADLGPAFYRYYIRDTTVIDSVKLVRLYFTPKNPNDLIFRGTMYITLDGNYSIQKIEMTISKKANVNWTRELKIKQDFEKGPDGRYHVIKSDMLTEFALVNSSSGSMYGERLVSFKNFLINVPAPDSIYKAKDEVNLSNVINNTDSFWIAQRHTPLSNVEAKAYYNIDSLKNTKKFKTFMTVVTALFTGYVVLGDYEIGNTNTFYSFNPVEGFRLRLGGRTTAKFNNNIYLENYIAYGFKDERFKYAANVTLSLNHKSIYAFPLHYLKVGYQYDMKIPGQELQYVQEDNFLLSFKRGKNDKWLYNRIFKTEYEREFGKNFQLSLGFKNIQQERAGGIYYVKPNAPTDSIQGLTTTEISAQIRWAPGEQFYQGKNYRIPIVNKYPIFSLRYIAGVKGLLGGQYNYHNLNLYAEKRFYMSQLGFTDITMEGGYTMGKVPFPLMTIHRANQTYGYQLNSYNLMNFLEFVSDKFYATNFDVHFNGFFLNKIPLLRKLKWREVASAKVLYGSVRDENNPAKNGDAFQFLKYTDPNTNVTTPATYTLDKGPYIEVSVGLANIFKLLRVDLIKRLTYLDHPDISKWGVRFKVRFEF